MTAQLAVKADPCRIPLHAELPFYEALGLIMSAVFDQGLGQWYCQSWAVLPCRQLPQILEKLSGISP